MSHKYTVVVVAFYGYQDNISYQGRISSIVECLTPEWEVTGLILRAAGPVLRVLK